MSLRALALAVLCGCSAGDARVEPVPASLSIETEPAGAIYGTVVEESGAPVAGASVELTLGSAEPAFALIARRVPTGIRSTTDDEGRYTLEHVAPGDRYVVVVRHPDFAQGEGYADLEGSSRCRLVPIVLVRGARISGTVTDRSGAPIADAKVELWNTLEANFGEPSARSASWKETKTDAEGEYEFENVHFTVMEVVVSKEGFATLSKNHTVLFAKVDDKEIGFELGPSHEISGHVLDVHGRPIANAVVEGWQIGSRSDKGSSKSRFVTGADGDFMLTGLADGNYAVYAKATGFSDKQNGETAAGTTDLVIALEPRGSVSGRVKAPDESPVARFTLRLMTSRPGGAIATKAAPQEFNDATGSFTFVDVEPGEYVLQADATGFAPSESLRFVAARETTTRGIEIAMRAGGKVEGTVVDAEKRPIRGARVEIHANRFVENPIQEIFENAPGADKPRKIETRTDASGHFELACLVPGSVQLAFRSSAWASRAIDDVTIIEGRTTDLGQIVLMAGGTIAVSCLDAAGEPLADATVSCTSGIIQTSRRPAFDGRVLFTHLTSGTWVLTVMPMKGNPLKNVIRATRSKQEAIVREGETSQVTLRAGSDE